jgi:AcrR family transcriptional regulator
VDEGPERKVRGEKTVRVNSSSKVSRREIGGVESLRASGGRRERHRLKTRAKITRAARTLFARKGFDATTTQEIAAKADIGTGTLFNYAKTKEDLLLLVFREEMDVVVERAFATIPSNGSLLDQLLHVFDAFVAYHQRDVEIAHALIRQLSSVNGPETRDDIIVFMRGLVGRISALVEDAQERGELRGHLPRGILAHNLFSIYYRLLQEWLGEYITYEQYAARIRPALELQLTGLRSDHA